MNSRKSTSKQSDDSPKTTSACRSACVPSNGCAEPSQEEERSSWNVLGLLTAFWLLLIAFCADWWPWVRGFKPWPPEWRWLHETGHAPLAAGALVAVGFAAWALVGWATRRLPDRPRRGTLAAGTVALIFLLAAFQLLGACTRTPRVTFLFAQRTYIEWLNSFFLASLEIEGPGAAWREFDRLLAEEKYPRVVTHPPGWVAYYATMRRAVEALGGGGRGGEAVASPDGAAFWRQAVEPLDAARVLPALELRTLVYSAYFKLLLANLALWPLVDLVRRRHGARTALRAGFLYALTPAAVLFVPSPDLFFLPLAALALWGFALGCDAPLGSAAHDENASSPPSFAPLAAPGEGERSEESEGVSASDAPAAAASRFVPERSRGWVSRARFLFVAGAAVALHSLFGYHFTVLIAVFGAWRGLMALGDWARGERPAAALRHFARDMGWFLAPLAATWAVLLLVFQYDYVYHWKIGLDVHRFGITRNRSYWGWTVWNLWDVAWFLGLPTAAAVAWGVHRAWRETRRRATDAAMALPPRAKAPASPDLAPPAVAMARGKWRRLLARGEALYYPAALLLSLVAVTFSGAVRGETARILMFAYPLTLPLAAGFLSGPGASRRFRLVALHQLAQLSAMALYLNLF